MKTTIKKIIAIVAAIMFTFATPLFAHAEKDILDLQKSVCFLEVTFEYTPAQFDDSYVTTKASGTGFAVGLPGQDVQYIATAAHCVYEENGVYTMIATTNGDIISFEKAKEGTAYPNRQTATVDGISVVAITDYWKAEATDIKAVFSKTKGQEVALSLVGVDATTDVALCRIASEPVDVIKAFPLQRSEDVKTFTDIVAIGYPAVSRTFNDEQRLDFKSSVPLEGKISQLIDTKGIDSSSATLYKAFEVSADISSGSSGGPVFDMNTGAILGIVSFGYDDGMDESKIVVSVDYLMNLLDDARIEYKTYGEGLPAYVVLGIIVCVLLVVIIVAILVLGKKGNKVSKPAVEKVDAVNSTGGCIIGVSGALAGRKFRFDGRAIIGRDSSRCNIVFPIDQPGVSAVHCEIKESNGIYTIMDCGSSYGTFLANGTKLNANTPVVLTKGGRFWVGTSENVFEVN